MEGRNDFVARTGLTQLWQHVVDLTHGEKGPTDANTIYHLTALKHSFWGAWNVLPFDMPSGQLAFSCHEMTARAIEDFKAGWK